MVNLIGKRNLPFIFACSVIGASHLKNGKPCQDASLCINDKKYSFFAVADGHGGDQYFRSDVGSQIAVNEAKDCMTNPAVLNALKTTRNEKERERIIEQLKKSILGCWNAAVYLHEDENHFTDEELTNASEKFVTKYRGEDKLVDEVITAYGSTLIAALQTDTFFLVLQIGDGNCVVVDKAGTFSQPVPVDEKCFLNVTTSLCEERAIENFRHYYSDTIPAAVLIGTDGIDDCFAGAEKLYGFYRLILSSFKEKDEESAKAELIDYLPRLSEKGSGDDISIGMIVDKGVLRRINLEKPEQNNDNKTEKATWDDSIRIAKSVWSHGDFNEIPALSDDVVMEIIEDYPIIDELPPLDPADKSMR